MAQPSGEPVKEQIMANLQTTLEGVNGGASYYTDFSKVERVEAGGVQVKTFPTAIISPLGTEYDSPNAVVTTKIGATFRVEITVFLRTRSNATRAVERAIRDVHTALYVDRTRGGLAIDTRVAGSDPFYPSEATEPICGADISVSITYRTQATDLNTAG